MNPDTRMAVSLALSLVVSARNLRMAAAGQADIVVVGFRYVVGFLAAFVVVGLIGRVLNGYVGDPELVRADERSPAMPTAATPDPPMGRPGGTTPDPVADTRDDDGT